LRSGADIRNQRQAIAATGSIRSANLPIVANLSTVYTYNNPLNYTGRRSTMRARKSLLVAAARSTGRAILATRG